MGCTLGYDMTTGLGSPSLTYVQYIANIHTSVPVANFSTNTNSGVLPLTVNFTDSSTNQPTTWLWNFSDRTTSNLQNPTHVFRTAGTYSVSLTVANTAGSNVYRKTITVSNPPALSAGFSCLSVNFKDLTTGENGSSYSWNFGDGYQSTQQHPTHTYTKGGSYTVQLTVRNSNGISSTAKHTLAFT